MTDKQWKANIRRIKDPKKLLAIIGADDFMLGTDPYYNDLWTVIFEKAKELSK